MGKNASTKSYGFGSRSAIISQKGGKLRFHAPIGALVSYNIVQNVIQDKTQFDNTTHHFAGSTYRVVIKYCVFSSMNEVK